MHTVFYALAASHLLLSLIVIKSFWCAITGPMRLPCVILLTAIAGMGAAAPCVAESDAWELPGQTIASGFNVATSASSLGGSTSPVFAFFLIYPLCKRCPVIRTFLSIILRGSYLYRIC